MLLGSHSHEKVPDSSCFQIWGRITPEIPWGSFKFTPYSLYLGDAVCFDWIKTYGWNPRKTSKWHEIPGRNREPFMWMRYRVARVAFFMPIFSNLAYCKVVGSKKNHLLTFQPKVPTRDFYCQLIQNMLNLRKLA